MTAPFTTTIFQWMGFARYNTSPQVTANGQPQELQSDVNGNLLVNVASYGGASPASWTDTVNTYQQVVKNAAGKLYSMSGSNEGTTKRWIQIFDAVAVPSNGAVPKMQLAVFAGGTFSIDLPRGRAFSSGIVWAISSTTASLTIDNAATFFVNAEAV